MELYNDDCLKVMKDLSNNSIDLLFCDLPYGETSCKWDCKINLELFWKEINRICKINCPMFFTTTTRFGVDLINSNPKNFRYDLVWIKSAGTGFLNAKKMPIRKHEMIYVFYRKLPYYNLESHKYKYPINNIKQDEFCIYDVNKNCYGGGEANRIKIPKNKEDHSIKYEPPLPNSVIKEEKNECYGDRQLIEYEGYTRGLVYEPPLPNSILEIKSQKGKHTTQKPTALIEWILKYYSKIGDTILDPTMGSGSTGIACKLMNRKFIGIEKDETIYNNAVIRLNT